MAGRRRRSRLRTRGRGAYRSRTRSNSSNNASTSPNGDSNPTRGRRGNQVRRRGPRFAISEGRAIKNFYTNHLPPESSQLMSRSLSSSTSGFGATGSGPGSRRASTPGDGAGSGPNPNPGPGGYGSQDNICPICRTQITNLCITNCNHRFCRDCIRRWTSRHATCPTCRANIHTIRNILPNGGTEIIQISRAELVAHKVNEIHSILMLLFTVMSHSLLPEVSNFLEQLNQIARELNVPTTTTRLENARAAAAQAAAEAGRSPRNATNSPTASTTSGSSGSDSGGIRGRSSSMGSGLFGLALSRRPERSDVSRSRSRSLGRFSGRQSSDSDDEASDTDATVGSSSGSNSASASPSNSAALMRMAGLGLIMNGGLGLATNLSNPPTRRNSVGSAPPVVVVAAKSLLPTTTSASRLPVPIGATLQPTSSSLSAGGKSISAPGASLPANTTTKSAATQTSFPSARSRPSGSFGSGPGSSGFDSARDNPRIRHTYQRPGGPLDPTGSPSAAKAATPTSTAGPSPGERRGPLTRSASAAALKSASASTSNQANEQSRPPTEEEARRNLEQRQRDIRFLTDSFNKINQVYEVLMIMHMVIHRNQVEVERPGEEPDSD